MEQSTTSDALTNEAKKHLRGVDECWFVVQKQIPLLLSVFEILQIFLELITRRKRELKVV